MLSYIHAFIKEGEMGVIKTVGNSGQISLGKKFAGQHVLVDEIESGVWIVKIGRFVPQNERWLHSDSVRTELDKAIMWAENNAPRPSDLNEIEERIKG
jgi:hypothetical protein